MMLDHLILSGSLLALAVVTIACVALGAFNFSVILDAQDCPEVRERTRRGKFFLTSAVVACIALMQLGFAVFVSGVGL